ncbi:acyclic terpene utilization AtuA family protein [Pusillimonas sp. SM2304]|uniref:acyclic terpene utilization AtuA family protein n=1 Tax=Pusillimonas sp. SM2304 TaxID=3073241 RepID=UPI002875CA72|nr:acyclic terpene utilization AtuA family protein [Pusillimonas sp. SM2304]MDS1141669.1 acyclic terpene utilization AtuA family protein [Pusillimonas sp. SM2304]
METTSFKIGCATGFSGDRTDGVMPVVDTLIQSGGHALIFETLAERTLALSQLAKNQNPELGYEPLLADLLRPALGACLQHGIRIVSNFGAANPPAAARRIMALAQELQLRAPRIAVLSGDQLAQPEQLAFLREQLGPGFDQLDIVSVNAYQGASEIAQALRAGADIVVAGRVADPSLVLGPALAHFGWADDDWHRLGCATIAGHLLECGTQVTGGYFAVPGLKDVPGMDALGFPIADISPSGELSISKAMNTGGVVNEQTVKEQLLYEVHDPAAYLTPDVSADISRVTVAQTADDVVRVNNVTGHPRPDALKVNICYHGGWLAEAEISYAGVQAEARARLAADTILKRLGSAMKVRVDLIGAVSLFSDDDGNYLRSQAPSRARDIRLRIAGAHAQKEVAERVLREVTALYTCGPAGGGGVRTSLRPRLNSLSGTVPRDLAPASWRFMEEQ